MQLNLDQIRNQLPNPESLIHMDNAGASPPATPVLNAMLEHLQLEQRVGGYRAQELTEQKQNQFYTATAKMIGCQSHELAFTDSATRAYDMAFYGIEIHPGQTVLLSPTEYASNHISIIQRCRAIGARWEVMPGDLNGVVDLVALAKRLDQRNVALVTVSHVPTNSGVVQPIDGIGKLTRGLEIPYLVDACQSVGQLALDVNTINCDVLSFTGRKFLRGPRGTGALFVREQFLDRIDPPILDLFSAPLTAVDDYRIRDDCRRFETWEFNVAAKIGLATAIQYYLDLGIEAVQARVCLLAARLADAVGSLPEFKIQDGVRGQCGIVTLIHSAIPASELHRLLADEGIFSTASGVDNSWLDTDQPGTRAVLRLSPHYFLTEVEVDKTVKQLEQIVSGR
jgi:cysteine desulfurase/selenocysteine lyase